MTLTMETRRLKIELWTVCRQVVADLHHFDDKQDPVPDPHLSEKFCPHPDPHVGEERSRIRNPAGR
jgi:hypothetical protein